jgi:hypothetical protein
MSTDAYLDAKAAFEQSDAKIKEFGQFLSAVGSNLMQKPGRFMFSNCQPGLPIEASMSADSISVNAGDWRSPQQIQESIADWHKKKDAMLSAWESVPHERREGLNTSAQSKRSVKRWMNFIKSRLHYRIVPTSNLIDEIIWFTFTTSVASFNSEVISSSGLTLTTEESPSAVDKM